jgi:hypothetical protein
MDKNEQKNIPLRPSMAVAVAPVVAFALANALFLPLALAVADFGDSFLVNLIPSNIPGSGYLMVLVLVLLFPITAAAVLVSPALTSFIANLICPILTNKPRAIWSGIVFFFFYSILLIILIVFRNLPLLPTPANYPFPTSAIDPLAIIGLLAGVVLSCSVTIFGWLGTRMRRKKS